MATSAIILAGGLGTRLRSVVPDRPKPMALISSRPFLEYQLDYWISQGVTSFVLAVGYRHEDIVNHFGSSYRGAQLDYVIEQTPMGTGGGLLLAAEKLSSIEPFLLLNGDTYFSIDLEALSAFFRKTDADWCFSMFRTKEEGRYMGMNITPEGEISSLRSGNDQLSRLANGGVYMVHPRALPCNRFSIGQKISLEDEILPLAMKLNQRLFGLEFDGDFIDIGVPHDYHRASALLGK